MKQFTTVRFECAGADLDLCSYSGVTVTTAEAKVELAKLTQEQLQAAVLSFVSNQSWRDRDGNQPDAFLEALIAKATETIRMRQEYREKQASA